MRWMDPDIYAMDGIIRTIPWHIQQIVKVSAVIENLDKCISYVPESRSGRKNKYISSTAVSYTEFISEKKALELKRDKLREELLDICKRYGSLDAESAEIISEYYDFQWTISEIADAHYISYSTARRYLEKALKKMMKCNYE